MTDSPDDLPLGTEVECDKCESPGETSTPDGDWLCGYHYAEWLADLEDLEEEMKALALQGVMPR